MLVMWLNFLLLALCCGAIAMTLTKSTLFAGFRKAVQARSKLLGELVECPYCTSHWLVFVVMALYQPRLINSGFTVGDYVVTTFALIAVSAMSAGVIYKLFAGK